MPQYSDNSDTYTPYFIPKFFQDALDDPLIFDYDLGLLQVSNNVPPGFLPSSVISDAQNRCCGIDGVNRPRPGHDLIASIASCTNVNGICHLNNNTFLLAVTVGGSPVWYKMVSNATSPTSGGSPSFSLGTFPQMAQGLNAVYVVAGSGLYKWNGTTWTPISIGNSILTGSPANLGTVAYFTNRIIVSEVGANVLYFSGFLEDGGWNTTNLMVQLDQFTQDSITAIYPFQQFQLAVFKNSSTWMVDCDPQYTVTTPSISMANTPITRISSTIGCCNPRTVAEIYNDVLFLSEGGRGVYSVGQIATNEQQAIKSPISLPIKGYINRINWSAISTAFATTWDDLYILHVPLDNATSPNYALIYCASLGTWQGLWTGYNGASACRQDTGQPVVRYIWCDTSGNIYQHYHQEDSVYVDTVNGNIPGGTPFSSYITTRGYRFDQETNLIQPFNIVYEFQSGAANNTVQSQLYADSTLVGNPESITVGPGGVTLPLSLPFSLGGAQAIKAAVTARQCGICSEVKSTISGTGEWHMVKVSPAAWVSRGTINQ